VVGKVTRLLVGLEKLWCDYRPERKTFLFSVRSVPALWATQLPVPLVQETLSSGLEWREREAGPAFLSSDKVKNEWVYNSNFSIRLYFTQIMQLYDLNNSTNKMQHFHKFIT